MLCSFTKHTVVLRPVFPFSSWAVPMHIIVYCSQLNSCMVGLITEWKKSTPCNKYMYMYMFTIITSTCSYSLKDLHVGTVSPTPSASPSCFVYIHCTYMYSYVQKYIAYMYRFAVPFLGLNYYVFTCKCTQHAPVRNSFGSISKHHIVEALQGTCVSGGGQ